MDEHAESQTRSTAPLSGSRLQLPPQWAAHDWAAASCGPPDAWPSALTSTVGLMLRSGFPMFVVWGSERTFLYNDAYIRILGDLHPQAFGRPFFSVWPGIENAIGPVIDEAFAGKESFFEDMEVRLVRSGVSEPAWFTFSYSPVLDEDGKALGALCVCVETTRSVLAHRMAAAELKRREAVEQEFRHLNETLERRINEALDERRLLADVLEDTDAFVQVVDLDYRWLAINRAAKNEFERIYGAQPRIGASMLELLADEPEHREAVRRVWSRALAGEAFIETGEFGDPERDRRYYEMKFNALRDANGKRVGAYQIVFDVTNRMLEQRRRQEAEDGKREAEELHRAYFQSAPDALFVIAVTQDGGFIVEQVNPAHEASVGYKLEDIRGKRIDEFMPSSLLEPVRETYVRVVRSGEIFHYRQVFELNGVAQHWDTSLVPVCDANGRVARIIGSSRNVTAQVAAEDALRQVQKMDALGQLTGGIAHDFNNVLGAVVGGFDLILRKPDDTARVQRLASNGLAAAERGARLTGQLLAFSRAQKIERRVVNVVEVVEGMRDMLQRTLGPQIVLQCQSEDGAAYVLSDNVQLEMAVLNLAINARDAMPSGGKLSIETSVRDLPGDPELRAGRYVELAVSDTGSGMTDDVIARAFEPFFTTKGVGKGTGLGLSQVYSVARQGGGAARVTSTLGAGTTVSMFLALADAEPDAHAADQEQIEPLTPPSAKILVIDDDHDMRRMLVETLEAIGFEVGEAADGFSGLDILAREAPDLVLLDYAMPGMNGAEVARAIRATRPAIPLVIASGFSDTAAIESVEGPSIPVLRKPFRVDELHAVLAEHLARKSDAGPRS